MNKTRSMITLIVLIAMISGLFASCKNNQNNISSSVSGSGSLTSGISSASSNDLSSETSGSVDISGVSGSEIISGSSGSSASGISTHSNAFSQASSKTASSTRSSQANSSQLPDPTPTPITTPFANFITRSGDKLMDGSKEFRFVGINAQDVDPIWMKSYPAWKNEYSAPTDYELEDIIRTVAQMGGEAIRDYTISAGPAGTFGNVSAHVTGIGQFSETAFKRLDRLLFYCNKYNVRLILGLTDYQDTLGGISTYTKWRGKSKEDFFSDPQIIADFKLTIDYVTNRYKNEKALLCWETGNEMPINAQVDAWAREITAYIKSKDPNHLVEDGRLGGYGGIPRISADSLNYPNVDIVSGHYYHWVQGTDYATYCNEDKALTKNKKVFLVEEFGYAGADVGIYQAMIDAAIDNGTSGVMIWALAHRSKNGGFYWHEGAIESMGNYWTYHWPGFFTGSSYNEIETLTLLRNRAYEIRGLNVPALPVPDAPLLFNITKVSAINWRGSTGASFYDIERATSRTGPWIVVGSDVSDALFNYTSLFEDDSATAGVSYYYRVKAKNAAGTSLPSNVIGPVKAT